MRTGGQSFGVQRWLREYRYHFHGEALPSASRRTMSVDDRGIPADALPMLRVYMDSTIVRACLDPKRGPPSRSVVRQSAYDDVVLVVSDLTVDELRDASADVRDILNASMLPHAERVQITGEVRGLADRYIGSGVFTRDLRADASHVAAATVAGTEVVATWNPHILDPKRIRRCNEVNGTKGYGSINAYEPWMLEHGMSDHEPEFQLPIIEPGEQGFRVMPWLRALRGRMYEETKGMTWEEERQWHAEWDRESEPSLNEWWEAHLAATAGDAGTATGTES